MSLARTITTTRSKAMGILVAGGVVGLCYWVLALRRRRQAGASSRGLPSRRPPRGYASRFVVTFINRTPNGRVGGLSALCAQDVAADDVAFEDLLGLERLVLYCLDIQEQLLIFLRIKEGVDLLAEPFLDRGVRKLADEKDYIYVASFDTAREHLSQRPALDSHRMTFIWNTGRCGSTLLHRLLVQAGVCSLSEPYWYEELARHAIAQDPAEAGELLHLCMNIDFPLARRLLAPDARRFALNGKAFAHSLLEPILWKFPHAPHIFMYRDIVEVVESFQSIFLQDVPFYMRLYSLYCCPPRATAKDITSDRLRRYMERRELPTVWKRSAERNGLMWLDGVCTWLEATKRYQPRAMVIRMDEFVNARKRKMVVDGVLRFVMGKEEGDAVDMQRCAKVFDVHSQQGDRMQRSSSYPGVGKALNAFDARQLRRLVAAVPEVPADGLLPGTAFLVEERSSPQ